MAAIKNFLFMTLLLLPPTFCMEDIDQYVDSINSVITQEEADNIVKNIPSHIIEEVFNGLEKKNGAVSSSSSSTDARNGLEFYGIAIPEETMIYIFSKLSVPDIFYANQVCLRWHALTEDHQLWMSIRKTIHGDYPETEATKKMRRSIT